MAGQFERNVFINCPFDDEYRTLLKPLLFTLRYCGLTPRIASERLDSSEIRLDKIIEMIQESKYSIHDLSRIKAGRAGEYYRLNMPLEVGIDLGCKQFHHDPKYREKKSLILEGERYSVLRALSDLAGADVRCHHNQAEKMVESVRSWLVEAGRPDVPGPNSIWDDFNFFNADLNSDLLQNGFKKSQIETLPIPEFLGFMDKWLDGSGDQ
ncbi:MAG: hypothetical protein KDC61_04865 [Saprospiraceae bacterium]|nr:hypothetical protein [Saprospiraceae bacterium]MCB0573880.1 hypothetical protein [Saprospiraceae bacterium]MCB9356839.1 hypothetical protein [Lewinellaceae bacterium]